MVAVKPRIKFKVADYHKMIEAGVFDSGERCELLYGEIFAMSPRGTKHAMCLQQINELFMSQINLQEFAVRIQDPITIPTHSEPEPDAAIVKRQSYSKRHPYPEDVALCIEVGDSSLESDKTFKAQMYAQAGIQEYWVVDLVHDQVLVHINPENGSYTSLRTYQPEEYLGPGLFEMTAFQVSRLMVD